MGDFNIDLLSFDTSQHTNEFIDNITSSSLQLQILQTTRIHKTIKLLLKIYFVTFPILKLKIQ